MSLFLMDSGGEVNIHYCWKVNDLDGLWAGNRGKSKTIILSKAEYMHLF